MPLFCRVLAAIFVTLLASSDTFAQQTQDLAFQRVEHLRHGINTSDWFAQSNDYSVQRLRTFTTADDIRLIRQLGFDHIRLSIDAEPLLAWQRNKKMASPSWESSTPSSSSPSRKSSPSSSTSIPRAATSNPYCKATNQSSASPCSGALSQLTSLRSIPTSSSSRS